MVLDEVVVGLKDARDLRRLPTVRIGHKRILHSPLLPSFMWSHAEDWSIRYPTQQSSLEFTHDVR